MNTNSTLIKLLVEFGKRKKKDKNKSKIKAKNQQPKSYVNISDVINNPLKANMMQDILTIDTKVADQIDLENGVLQLVLGLEKLGVELNTIIEYNENIYSNNFKQDHAERVVIITTLIALQEKIKASDLKLLVIASKYHDIGRNNDEFDVSHGKKGVALLKKHNILNHLNQTEQNIIYAIIEAHSELDKDIESVLHKYSIPLSEFKRIKTLCCTLKDAEALDKVRQFSQKDFVANRMLKSYMLKTSSSKKLINFSFQLNEYYYEHR